MWAFFLVVELHHYLLHRRVRPSKAAVASRGKASSLMRQSTPWPMRGRSYRKLLWVCRTLTMRMERWMWVFSKFQRVLLMLFPGYILPGYITVYFLSQLFPFFSITQIEEQIESMFNSKKRVKDLSAAGAAAGAAGAVSSTAAVSAGGLPGLGPTSAGNIQKLEMAKRLALKINAQKNLGAEAQVKYISPKY